jgi:hypothetical protein
MPAVCVSTERARFGAAHRPPSSDLWLDRAAARSPGVAWPACIAQPRTTPPVCPRPPARPAPLPSPARRCRRAARTSERARFGAAHRPPSSDLWLDRAAARCPGVAWPACIAQPRTTPPVCPRPFKRPLVPPRCRRRPGGAARASERARFGAAHRPPSSDLWLDGAAARCPGVAWPACIAQPRTTPPVSPRPLVPPRAARQRVCEARRHARARQEYSHEEVSHPLCAADGPPSLCGRVGSWRRGAQ